MENIEQCCLLLMLCLYSVFVVGFYGGHDGSATTFMYNLCRKTNCRMLGVLASAWLPLRRIPKLDDVMEPERRSMDDGRIFSYFKSCMIDDVH